MSGRPHKPSKRHTPTQSGIPTATNSSKCMFRKACANWMSFCSRLRNLSSLPCNWFARICSKPTISFCANYSRHITRRTRNLHRHRVRPNRERCHETLCVRCDSRPAFFSRRGNHAAALPGQKDYLSSIEADKIRDAETPDERIKLFLSFADDRLKKLQYELEHPSQTRHVEMLNSLLNAYVGCVDDAADLIQLGIEKQQNIRKGINLM